MKDYRLSHQLRLNGAKLQEAESLARLAGQLKKVSPPGLSPRTKQRIWNGLPVNDKPKRSLFTWKLAGSLAGAAALILLVVQVILPGSGTIDMRSGEEKVRSRAEPEYAESVLQELGAEVEQLQKQETVDPQALQDAERRYHDTYERFKNRYQDAENFRNFDWDKWRRESNERFERSRAPVQSGSDSNVIRQSGSFGR